MRGRARETTEKERGSHATSVAVEESRETLEERKTKGTSHDVPRSNDREINCPVRNTPLLVDPSTAWG